MADEQEEGLAYAIVYPAKTKPPEAFKKQPLACGNVHALRTAAEVSRDRTERTFL
jgi:hypothetical protein